MRGLKTVLAGMLAGSCMSIVLADAEAGAESVVQWQGTLHAVHNGDTSAKINLQRVEGIGQLYAVGPVADLDGEITAIDGELYVSRVRPDGLETSADYSADAAFLVWAEVDDWQAPIALGEAAQNLSALEQRLAILAAAAGMDLDVPFPFVIEGNVESVLYHVLVPMDPDNPTAGHSDNALKVSLQNEPARIVGFFSTQHQGVFTHRGSTTHMHIVDRDGHAGHIDELAVDANVRVRFPR